jgi:antitoxin (DNA-binding transcriptional repressor) of toxin-antitoxin stability system
MSAASNKHVTRIGKKQAREQFAALIDALSTAGGVVEVTDYGKVVAVMLSYRDYLLLSAQANEPFKPRRQLAGSAVLTGDIEEASKQISENILRSISDSTREL